MHKRRIAVWRIWTGIISYEARNHVPPAAVLQQAPGQGGRPFVSWVLGRRASVGGQLTPRVCSESLPGKALVNGAGRAGSCCDSTRIIISPALTEGHGGPSTRWGTPGSGLRRGRGAQLSPAPGWACRETRRGPGCRAPSVAGTPPSAVRPRVGEPRPRGSEEGRGQARARAECALQSLRLSQPVPSGR